MDIISFPVTVKGKATDVPDQLSGTVVGHTGFDVTIDPDPLSGTVVGHTNFDITIDPNQQLSYGIHVHVNTGQCLVSNKNPVPSYRPISSLRENLIM